MDPRQTIEKVVLCVVFRYTPTVFILLTIMMIHSSSSCSARNLGNESDHLALLEIKSGITDDPHKILSSWNKSTPHCDWLGVTCGPKHKRVVGLDLIGQNLTGTISPHIGNLSYLEYIYLINNTLYGEIPRSIGRLSHLRRLHLKNNTLVGDIPSNLSFCTELNLLVLTRNKLTGKLPFELGSLKKLVNFHVGANNLTGEIPRSFGNLTSLETFELQQNSLQGSIPNELSKLTNLTGFTIGLNYFSGMFPSYIFNISSLEVISTAVNPLIGSLPSDIGSTLPNLQAFAIGGMQFTGTIPYSLVNASKIYLLDLADNNFTGHIPNNFGSLSKLEYLGLGYNELGGDPKEDLGFLEPLTNCTRLGVLGFDVNNLTGMLPESIGNLSSQLHWLNLRHNQITGLIPKSLGSLTNLITLVMDGNFFSGAIPSSFGRLKQLQRLNLSDNQLSGDIPSSIGNLSHLGIIALSKNRFEGSIPESIGNCKNLQQLELNENNLTGLLPPQIMGIPSLSGAIYLQKNRLSGPLPAEIGKLVNLNVLSLAGNNFSGEIPKSIGDCLNLEYLSLQGNSFQGRVPSTLSSLKSIKFLDLSQNNLSGEVPQVLESLVYLRSLNLSFNNLEGEIPRRGVFANVSALSILGNGKLCGGIPELERPACPIIGTIKEDNISLALILIITLACFIFFIVIISLFVLYWRRKETNASVDSLVEDKLIRISYWELHKATDGFSSESSIGFGAFGSVYKGKLDNQTNKIIAVKVLNLHNSKASKSFMTECKILSNVRHRNLLKILTYCSSINSKREEFKAIVYEFMPNGNLDKWLHPDEENISRTLSLLQRLNIAIDVASALQYLHSQCQVPIVHCDLKPSNILLDDDFCARVGDFGLARFCPIFMSEVSQLSSIGMKGSIGYAAPEYGTGSDASASGDVYSFGIILLEMMTGKRPTDDIFKEGLNLHNYVKMALPNQVRQILDPVLDREQQELSGEEGELGSRNNEIREIGQHIGNIGTSSHGEVELEKCIVSILTIALSCSEEAPTQQYGTGSDVSALGDQYSYGIILLEMMTGRRPTDDIFRDGFTLHNYVKTALPNQVMKILDPVLGGEGQVVSDEEEGLGDHNDEIKTTEQHGEKIGTSSNEEVELEKGIVLILTIALACSEESPTQRMNMNDVTTKLHRVRGVILERGSMEGATALPRGAIAPPII